jgi:hypothetical protein
MAPVYHFPRSPQRRLGNRDGTQQESCRGAEARAFKELTRDLIQAQAARGELPPTLLDYLLTAAGVP